MSDTDQDKVQTGGDVEASNFHQNQDERSSKEEQESSQGDEPKKAKKKNSQKVRKRGRANKIYRTPPTPTETQLLMKEKSFVLDCGATSSISRDYSTTNPKLGPVIPPYNSQRDTHVTSYFRFYGVNQTLKKTGQYQGNSTSIEGPVSDRFHEHGPGFYYLSRRNAAGAGHSQETIDGHAQFMKGIQGVSGYNGKYGFRRNTPWLRKAPTPFVPSAVFPTH